MPNQQYMTMEKERKKNETVFPAKFDWWLVIVCSLAFTLPAIDVWLTEEYPPARWLTIILCCTLGIPILYELFFTRYVVTGELLKVHSRIGKTATYNLEKLISIKPTHNLYSAPAPSLDRLELRFADGTTLLISPKDKAGFMHMAQEIMQKEAE